MKQMMINWKQSENFQVKLGLRQGDLISTVLLNIALETVIRRAEINRSGQLCNKNHQCMTSVVDMVIGSKTIRKISSWTL